VKGFRAEAGAGAVTPLGRTSWSPQARLDLHGLRLHELDDAAVPFVESGAARGLKRLLLIHGKGTHSPSGAGVLAEALVRLLSETELARCVRAFRSAPARLGGSGALALEIVKPKSG
jgi:DNA-nicking Smr family endonuclease